MDFKQTYTEATTWCPILKEITLALVHSPPLHPFASDLQDPSLRDTPIDPQGDMEFSIKYYCPPKSLFL